MWKTIVTGATALTLIGGSLVHAQDTMSGYSGNLTAQHRPRSAEERAAFIVERAPRGPDLCGALPSECRPEPALVESAFHAVELGLHVSARVVEPREPAAMLDVLTLELAIVRRVVRWPLQERDAVTLEH